MAKKKKAKAKKETNFNKTPVKAVFLYGKPNKEKLKNLKNIQDVCTDATNKYVDLLVANQDKHLLAMLKNDKKDSELRQFEKQIRFEGLPSAYSQNCFDDALTKLSNRLVDIKNNIYGIIPCCFTSSKVLFASTLQSKSKPEMLNIVQELLNIVKKNKEFYQKMYDEINVLSDSEFDEKTNKIRELYKTNSDNYKIPYFDNVWVKLDSRLHTLEESKTTKTTHVINLTSFTRGERIAIPINTSKRSISRMKSYKPASTVLYTITEKGLLKLQVPVEKTVVEPEIKTFKGVDTGIADAFHTSDDEVFGTFTEILSFYDEKVLPKLSDLNDLRNKKHKLKKYLKDHKNLPDDVRKSIIDKMDRIEQTIQKNKIANRKLNEYHSKQAEAINKTIKEYINSLKGDTSILTVIEKLDIKEFNKSRKSNRMLSTFARGQLQQRLMEQLNWYGYAFKEIEPAYTSQVCPHCFNLNKENRDGKIFKCTECGYENDADHVGSINIRQRAFETELSKFCEKYKYNKEQRHNAIKEYYEIKQKEYLNTKSGQ